MLAYWSLLSVSMSASARIADLRHDRTDSLSGKVCSLVVDMVSAVTSASWGTTYSALGSLEDDGGLGVAGSLESYIQSVTG